MTVGEARERVGGVIFAREPVPADDASAHGDVVQAKARVLLPDLGPVSGIRGTRSAARRAASAHAVNRSAPAPTPGKLPTISAMAVQASRDDAEERRDANAGVA